MGDAKDTFGPTIMHIFGCVMDIKKHVKILGRFSQI
jgi:hypothetical protein